MQNGLIFGGALLGKTHIKWGAKVDRKEGEMIELAIVHEDGQRQVVANKTIGDNRWYNANA